MSLGLNFDLMNRGTRRSSPDIKGQGYDLKIHINIHWVYMALPALLTLAALALVLMTMSKSIRQKVPFWKSSAIATLLLQIEPGEDGVALATPQRLSDMEARAEEVRLKLVDDDEAGGMRFVACKG
jgi:hypothetical protein